MQVFGEWAQVEVVELVNDGSGLAFGIVGGRSSGVVVKSVLPGGVADRDGRLHPGDMLLRIGSVSVVGMCARQAAAVLRQCGARVRLLVARPATDYGSQSLGASQAPIVPSRFLTEPIELERRLAEAGHEGFGELYEDNDTMSDNHPTIIEERHLMRPVASIVAVVPRGALTAPQRPAPRPAVTPLSAPLRLPLDMAVRSSEPESVSYEVELNKDSTLGLGITVAGYVCEQEELSGIFVKSISEGSAAHQCGKIQVNDRIVEVDGVSLNGVSNHKAVALLRDAKGPKVTLKALRYLRGAGFEKLQRALAAQDGRLIVAPPSPSVTSLSKFNFSVYEESTVIEPNSPSPRPPTPASPEVLVDLPSGESPSSTREEEIRERWRELLKEDVDWPDRREEFEVVVGTIMREKNTGLGISLEGTVKVIGGKEVAARHYIRAIAPNGPVAKLGVHRVGDELLEVNGWRVLGAHHVEVVSRLRAAPSTVTLVCVRLTRRENRTLVRNNLGGSLQDLLQPPQRLIKAKSESSVNSLCDTGTLTSIDHDHNEFCIDLSDRNRSRSLEPLSGLAMWSDQIEYVDLVKGDRGLGFSILDYLDPVDPKKTVLVVRSVVAGGPAAGTGRVAAGDRVVAVGGRDVRGDTLHNLVSLIKHHPPGIVTLGIAKPLPCSTIVGGHNGNSNSISSQEYLNSITSDDQTNLDSYHECLQEYGEGLEVVHFCLDPEDPSIREETSAVDFSFEEKKEANINGGRESKDSAEDEELTITEDVASPRELPEIRKMDDDGLSKQQSKDISTSDEMVFAVTPTGLERINFDYWDRNLVDINNVSDLNRNDSIDIVDTDKSSTILFIDHDFDGYETCMEDNTEKTDDRKAKSTENIKRDNKIDDSVHDSAKNKLDKQKSINYSEDESSHGKPYVQEHIVKQMKSLHIEPLNINIGVRKHKKNNKTKCVEYYNDQEECLKEYNRLKELTENQHENPNKESQNKSEHRQKPPLKKQPTSEESTDLDYLSDCHRCFLENYAYEITKAYIDETNCRFCAVIREMLGAKPPIGGRRSSAPASFSLDSSSSEEEYGLMVPIVKDRRRSAEPLKFVEPFRRNSKAPSTMTVTVGGRGSIQQRWGPARRVTLNRTPDAPLGVSIVGGKVDIVSSCDSDDGEEKTIVGIFIKNVVDDSPAGNSGELHTGDRILEVDGVCVRAASHERAVQLIKAAGDSVTLTVQSLLAWNTDSSDVEYTPSKKSPTASIKKLPAPPPPEKQDTTPEHEIKITVTSENGIEHDDKAPEAPAPAPAPVYSDSESSDEEDERELSGRTCSEKGVEIDRASAGAIKRSREEKEADKEEEDEFGYTTNKIRKKYAALGDSIVVVRLERSKTGLGLSLAGHRDRSRMAVFICGLNPTGSAAKASPSVKVGDEILEVNGVVLHGRCHLNASAIIKGLAGPVFKIVLLRRKQALEDVAVKPLTQFPVQLEEEAEDKFAAYKGVRNVSIKKGTSSLGIMIIEGRHAEVGRGIFISDIQDGSAAEQAGLQIGDMILAVNKDSLLECTYDTAAATLKRTEGLVVLTVCNPNKKDAPSEEVSGSLGSKSSPTSRNQTPDPSLKAPGSRPTTPKPAASPAKSEPPADPATAQIQPNKETVIEINTQNKSLGIIVLGGSDTFIQGPAAVILEVYPGGAAGTDGRLQPGDQICEVAGTRLTPSMTHERVCLTVKVNAPKIKMSVYRPSPIPYEEIEVELIRKSGKGLGLGVMQRTPAPGVYIAHVLPGSPADLDGRLQMGDILHSVDGKDVSAADSATAAAILKTAMPKANIRVKRFKIVR